MRVKAFPLVLVVLLGILSPLEVIASQVTGTVEAVDTSARPPTFVLKTTIAGGKDLIVGCRLDDQTLISVRGRAAKLEQFRAGSRAHLIYLRAEDGLVCRNISKK